MHISKSARSNGFDCVFAAGAVAAAIVALSRTVAAEVVVGMKVEVQAAAVAEEPVAPVIEAAKAEDKKPAAAEDRPRKKRKVPEDGIAAEAEPQPKPKRAARPAPAAAQLVINPQNQNAMVAQMRAQLVPMLKAELSFAKRAADLNDDECRALVGASKKWLDDFLVDFAKNQNPQQQQMWMQNVRGIVIGGDQPKGDDPRETIQKGMTTLTAATLPADKATAYVEECRKRTEFEHRVAIDNLVQKIDEKVILSPDQRAKITADLSEHWDENWAPQLEIFAINMQMWPSVPDQWVNPHLTESQQAVLKRINRVSGRVMIGGVAFGMDNEMIDDIHFDEVPPTANEQQAVAPVAQPVTVEAGEVQR